MHFTASIAATLALLLAPAALAKPDTSYKHIFYEVGGSRSWQLLADDADKDIYYRLPDGFSVVPAPGTTHGVTPQRAANGDLLLTLSLGPNDWSSEEDAVRAAIRAATGREAHFATISPRFLRLDLDPDLVDDFGVTLSHIGGEPTELLPGSRWLAQLLIPAAREPSFVRRVVQGAGFASLVVLTFRVDDPVLGTPSTTYPYAVSFFIGGLDFCEVKPDLPCS